MKGDGNIKTKQFTATHLSEGKDAFDNALHVRSKDPNKSALILVGNGRLIDHSGTDIHHPGIQALIGKAIELRLIPFGGV
jgi:hypothetical protein